MDDLPGQMKSFSIPEHINILSESLYQLQQDSTFCDVILIGEDGDIKAHSVVLSAVSPYFRQWVSNSETTINGVISVYLTGELIQDLQNLVTFIYTGFLSLSLSNIDRIIKLLQSVDMHSAVKHINEKIVPSFKNIAELSPPDIETVTQLTSPVDISDEFDLDCYDKSDDSNDDMNYNDDGNGPDDDTCKVEYPDIGNGLNGSRRNITHSSNIGNAILGQDNDSCQTENLCKLYDSDLPDESKNSASIKSDSDTIEPLSISEVSRNSLEFNLCHQDSTMVSDNSKKADGESRNSNQICIRREGDKMTDHYSIYDYVDGIQIKKCSICDVIFENDEFENHWKEYHTNAYANLERQQKKQTEDMENKETRKYLLRKTKRTGNRKNSKTESLKKKVSVKIPRNKRKTKASSTRKLKTKTKASSSRKPKTTNKADKKTALINRREVIKTESVGQNSDDTDSDKVNHETDKNKHRVMKRRKAIRYLCTYEGCGYTTNNKGFMARHKDLVHGEDIDKTKVNIFRCEVKGCNYYHVQKCRIVVHMKDSHSEIVSAICDICGKGFKHQKSLIAHKKSHVPVEKRSYKFTCPVCNKKFLEKGTLQGHLKKHEGHKYLCHLCTYSSLDLSRTRLDIHLFRVHNVPLPDKVKIFRCTQCDYYTFYKGAYESHMSKHSGEKFECDLCGKSYTSQINLMAHKKRHQTEKEKCPFESCNYFGEVNNVKQHIQTMHRFKNMKPFTCHLCEYRCNLQGNLTKHLRGKHKLEVETTSTLWRKLMETGQGYDAISDQNRMAKK